MAKRRGKKTAVTLGSKSGKRASPATPEVVFELSTKTGIDIDVVRKVIDSLSEMISTSLGPSGTGSITIPGLAEIKVVKNAKVAQRKGINPFTGEEVVFRAKPARKIVKVTPIIEVAGLPGMPMTVPLRRRKKVTKKSSESKKKTSVGQANKKK